MLARYLICLALLAVLPAQELPQVKVVDWGKGLESHIGRQKGGAPSEWMPSLGRGRDGPLAATQVGRRIGAASEPALAVRIEGGMANAPVAARWAWVELTPKADRATVVFEHDCPMVDGAPGWQMSPAPRFLQKPARYLPRATDFHAQCVTDAIAFAKFWGEHGRGELPDVDEIDFETHVVIAEPEQVDRDGIACWQFDQGLRVICEQGNLVRDGAPRMALHLVPRVLGELQLDVEVPTWVWTCIARRVASYEIADPVEAPLVPVLRKVSRDVEDHHEHVCTRAASPGEWRELRTALPEFEDLPDDWCDFTCSTVVAIVTEKARVWPCFEVCVDEEEGVDVVTAIQLAPSGRDPGERSSALLLVLPKREGQLAVVLRLDSGLSPGGEKTLRVFPGFGR